MNTPVKSMYLSEAQSESISVKEYKNEKYLSNIAKEPKRGSIQFELKVEYLVQIIEALFSQDFIGIGVLDINFNYLWVNDTYAKTAYRNVLDFPGYNHFDLFYCEKLNRFLIMQLKPKRKLL